MSFPREEQSLQYGLNEYLFEEDYENNRKCYLFDYPDNIMNNSQFFDSGFNIFPLNEDEYQENSNSLFSINRLDLSEENGNSMFDTNNISNKEKKKKEKSTFDKEINNPQAHPTFTNAMIKKKNFSKFQSFFQYKSP